MKITLAKLASSFFVAGLLMTSAASYSADTGVDNTEHPMAYSKDSIITTKIKAKLADEKMNSLLHVGVETDDQGVVTLSGHVKTQEEVDKAGSIARGTEGVTSVKNTIKIKNKN